MTYYLIGFFIENKLYKFKLYNKTILNMLPTFASPRSKSDSYVIYDVCTYSKSYERNNHFKPKTLNNTTNHLIDL